MSVYRKSYHIITATGRTAIAAAPVIGFAIALSMPAPSKAYSGGDDCTKDIAKKERPGTAKLPLMDK